MTKVFYIDHVQRNAGTTILKCYAVKAETFEEAVALHNSDWENLVGKAKFPPEIAHMAEKFVDGWSIRRIEELKPARPLDRKENGIDDETEEWCDCDACCCDEF